MEYNNLYVTHNVILANLSRIFKSKKFQPDDIMEWCQIYMNQYAKDVEMMVHYVEVGLDVPLTGSEANRVYTPCNIFRLLDVYDSGGNRIEYSFNGSYIFLPAGNTLSVIYLNYIGTPVDEEGIPLIPKPYINGAEVFCKVKAFEEDMMQGRISAGMYELWNQQLSGMTANAKNDFRFKDQHALDKLNIIKGNLIPVIANIKLSNKYFE
jgi:hypothetical protein